MRIVCVCCGRQAVDYVDRRALREDKTLTTLRGARAGFRPGECYCGECASDMDENGLFPEERETLGN